jgi:hypothetical protein
MPATIHDITRGPSRLASGHEQKGTPELASDRQYWRAIVRTGGTFGASREGDRLEWHLAACEAPHAEGQHCTEGLHNIEVRGQPDGHCLVNGTCGLCGETAPRKVKQAA